MRNSSSAHREMGKAGKRSDWIIDSGASCHMTWEKELFFEYRELSGSTVKLCDGRTVEAMDEGTVRVSVYRGDGKLHTLSMINVLHVPELSCNLMSVGQITDHGFLIQFKNDRCQIKSVGVLPSPVASNVVICTSWREDLRDPRCWERRML